ncbi:MAG: hypothetical protein HY319_06745 [Armatimonadetes bacterium]|nr:hypothetical protein [Armatimonadota bacterium]
MIGVVPRLKAVLCGLLVGFGITGEEAYDELLQVQERIRQLDDYRRSLGDADDRWAGIEECFAAGTHYLHETVNLAADYLETGDSQLLERACQALGEGQTALQDVSQWIEEASRQSALGVDG